MPTSQTTSRTSRSSSTSRPRARYGLKPGDVRRQASTLIASEEVGDIFIRRQGLRRARVEHPEARDSVTDVEKLPIDTPERRQVRLERGGRRAPRADARTPSSASTSRAASTSAPTCEGRDLGSVVDDVEERIAEVEFPLEYHAGGARRVDRAATPRRTVCCSSAPRAAIAIFLLLQAAFGSLRLAVLAFLMLPMALVGGVLAVWLGDGMLSLGSLVGFLTVFGIAARNGILMISHFQHLEHDEGEPFGPELVLRGAKERLAPILMTALATGLALVPLAVAGSIPGHEIEHPMAIVILGGLVTSTLLNLFVAARRCTCASGGPRPLDSRVEDSEGRLSSRRLAVG